MAIPGALYIASGWFPEGRASGFQTLRDCFNAGCAVVNGNRAKILLFFRCVLMRHSVVFLAYVPLLHLMRCMAMRGKKMKITSRLQTQRGGKEDLMRAFKQHVSQDTTEICLKGFLSP